MDYILNILGIVNLFAIAFLWYFVKTHFSNRIEEHARTYGALDAKITRLPELVEIQKEIKQGQADVELVLQRTLNTESLTNTKRLEFLERRLSEFYWPLYWGLQKDNAVWEKILDRKDKDPLKREIGIAIEEDFILPNHHTMVDIIQSKIHLAEKDNELEKFLLQYVRHVAVYRSMRKAGNEEEPLTQGEPWPGKLFPIIERHTKKFQREYDTLVIRNFGDSAPAERPERKEKKKRTSSSSSRKYRSPRPEKKVEGKILKSPKEEAESYQAELKNYLKNKQSGPAG
ncbi:MAG: hypothetical protein GY765_08090 [bacterium]|nr:hypothetical protein [bacterium]